MQTSTLLLLVMSVTLAVVAGYAWRIGNDRRDVALLGGISALCGTGALVTASF